MHGWLKTNFLKNKKTAGRGLAPLCLTRTEQRLGKLLHPTRVHAKTVINITDPPPPPLKIGGQWDTNNGAGLTLDEKKGTVGHGQSLMRE